MIKKFCDNCEKEVETFALIAGPNAYYCSECWTEMKNDLAQAWRLDTPVNKKYIDWWNSLTKKKQEEIISNVFDDHFKRIFCLGMQRGHKPIC